ncbi:MAG: hypothetical protein HYU69_12330 [Bacteroidetes bacterium]|nr:hypothetical protein [Bacteroidota bacterium]
MQTIHSIRMGIFVSSIMILSSFCTAQNENFFNNFKPPHSGRLKAAKNYFVELLFTRENTFVYLFDSKDQKPVNNTGVTGKIVFIDFDNTSTSSDLGTYNNDGFIAKTNIPAYKSCIVSFDIRGEHISAQFDDNENMAERKKTDRVKSGL